jgi:type I restriction enzyme S subunit
MITMKNNNIEKNYNIPGLRFPEFKNDGEWNLEPFGDVYSFKVTNSFSRENFNYVEGSVKNIHYGDIHTKFSALFDITNEIVPYINPSMSIDKIRLECYCIEGDMIFADASEDLNDIGKSIEICNLNDEKLVSGLHTLLARQKRPKFIVGFGGHLFLSNGIRTQIQREAQGSKVLSISTGRLSNIIIYYPENKKEQQKIASCLSSLDELIAAENQKLEALKTHKKGLMQQLFPAEGETVPQLRFKEFRDSGEWEVSTLGEISIISSGGTPSRSENGYWNGDIPWVSTTLIDFEIINEANEYITLAGFENSSTKVFPINTILMAMYGQGKTRGKVAILGIDAAVNQACAAICLNKGFDTNFVFQNLAARYDEIRNLSNSGGQENLSSGLIKNIPFTYPDVKTGEQQKIASCLSSLDELIAAQSQKTEALKVHKKGLMQGLFPNVNEL